MKTNLHTPSISALCILAALTLAAMPGTASAQVYVANKFGNRITEYTGSGAFVGSGTLINGSGLSTPIALSVYGPNILATNYGNNTITEYNATTGARVGSGTLVSGEGLDEPYGIAVSGSDIFVVNSGNDTITEYNATTGVPVGSGTLVNGLGLYYPEAMAISGSDIFVANNNNTITEYTTAGARVGSGTLVNVSGLEDPEGIAVSGSDIFVTNGGNNAILEYTTTGVRVGSGTLVSGEGLDEPYGIAVSGSDIFVTNNGTNTLVEYTTAGEPVGSGTLVSNPTNSPTGLVYPTGIVVVPVISDAISLGGGWNWSKTIGYFAGLPPGWIYHEQLGWLYFDTDDISSNIWIWDPASGMGWVWTNLSTYPNMYRASDGAWLWYDEGTTGPCWFYNLTASKWESH